MAEGLYVISFKDDILFLPWWWDGLLDDSDSWLVVVEFNALEVVLEVFGSLMRGNLPGTKVRFR